MQVLLDSSSEPTTGNITVYEADLFAHTAESGGQSANGDVVFTVTASRNIHIESEIIGGSGTKTSVVFDQKLSYSNTQMYLDNITIQVRHLLQIYYIVTDVAVIPQIANQTATGVVSSTHNGQKTMLDEFAYPFFVNLTITNPNGSACK